MGSQTQYWQMLNFRWRMCFALLLLVLAGCSSDMAAQQPPAATPTRAVQVQLPSLRQRIDGSDESLRTRQLERVQQILAGMTLDQKLGQLLVVEYLGNSYAPTLQYMVAHQYVGGFLYQEVNSNFDPPDNVVANVAAFSSQAMHDASVPLLIGTDQEGGLVNRLYTFHGYLPSAQEMAATGDAHYVYSQGAMAAKWLAQLGINADLAPVADVQTVSPPVLQTRMFGSDPNTVATFAGAFLNGLQQNGVIGCLKHFPGLGAITSDPHADLPVVNRSLADLESIDFEPYRLMLQKDHPAMIMSTDVLVPAIDAQLPAELSPKTIDGVLRQQLGFDGVVITDGLYMAGISQRWSLPEAAVLSVMAGDDLVEGPYTESQVAEVIAAFKQALQDGRLTMARINQSVERILLMKARFGIIE